MLQQNNTLKVKNEKREYIFNFELDSPIGEIYDVLFQMKSFVAAQIEVIETNEKQKKCEATNANKECQSADLPN